MFSWIGSWFSGSSEEPKKDTIKTDIIEDKKGLADSIIIGNTESISPLSDKPELLITGITEIKLKPAAARACPVDNIKTMPASMIVITLQDIQMTISKLNHVEINQHPPQRQESNLMKELHNKFLEKRLSEKNIEVTSVKIKID